MYLPTLYLYNNNALFPFLVWNHNTLFHLNIWWILHMYDYRWYSSICYTLEGKGVPQYFEDINKIEFPWFPYTNLWYISKKGISVLEDRRKQLSWGFLWHNLFVHLVGVVNLDTTKTLWITSTYWVEYVMSYLSLLFFTLHTLLLFMFLWWSFRWSCQHFYSQCPLKFQWWKNFLELLYGLLDISLFSHFLWIC